jgi:hypothetical protein
MALLIGKSLEQLPGTLDPGTEAAEEKGEESQPLLGRKLIE